MNSKVVLITGALTGIGRAAALAFAKEGARLNLHHLYPPGVFSKRH
jgi:NAD(P)-dependent dehydrogenase (short-subunit alcohol dehydrogenase family)